MGAVTAGIDIGTTSVKAVAVDDDGTVLARARIPHQLIIPAPDLVEHDANRAWRLGPRRALAALGDLDLSGVAVAAMVPSMTAVDRRGRPLTAGVIYGDARGRTEGAVSSPPTGTGEVVEFLRWSAQAAPGAYGYWPAQAVANKALGGPPAVDLAVGITAMPLFGPSGWDPQLCQECGASPEQLAKVEMTAAPVGRLGPERGAGPVLAAGSVDVWCEQLVAGAGEDGDVHVICGTTLIVWAVRPSGPDVAGLWSVGHSIPGRQLIGGASNAGGLFVDWAGRLLRPALAGDRGKAAGDGLDPRNLPVWAPYPRGERTPYHDPARRAAIHDLDLTHGPAAIQRAAWEASGFVVRHHLDLAGVRGRRVVATGGGTRVEGWMQALADVTGLPVHVAADPEGAARGAAFLARVAAGLETDVNDAARWAATGRVIEPDGRWAAGAAERYRRFRQVSGPPGGAAPAG
jgi:xylulokinase